MATLHLYLNTGRKVEKVKNNGVKDLNAQDLFVVLIMQVT